MTDDPKDGLSATLAHTGSDAALTALRCSIAWAATSLSTQIGEDDDVVALQCVIGLDDALADLEKLLGLVPAVVRIASPGRPVEERLADCQARLDQEMSELASNRAALAAAGDIERRLEETQAERDQTQTQIGMLERRQQIAEDLPGLQARLRKLRDATDKAMAGPVEQVAQGLVKAVRQLADLTDQQRSLIGADLSKLASEAVAAGQALAAESGRLNELKAEVTARQAEADELRREYKQALPGLELYRQADQALAGALTAAGLASPESALEGVRGCLTDIEQRLSDLDSTLKPLLDQHASAYADALAIRNWAGSS